MTALRTISKTRRLAEVSGRRTVEVPAPLAPPGIRPRWDDIHQRIPKNGEITRLIRAFLIHYFQQLPEEVAGQSLNLYELQFIITEKLGSWLGGLLGREHYYVSPSQIAHILRGTEVNGRPFVVQGDIIRLLHHEEAPMSATVRLLLEGTRETAR